jgi:hypothetical protein
MKIEKVDLNKTDFQSEDKLKIYLRDLVLDYASQMNTIENDICKKEDAEPEKDFFPKFKQRYLPVFEAYCSDKKRSYGGQADSYGSPSKFGGIENFVEYSVELKNKNRAEVYFKTTNDENAEYLFVLLRNNKVWRIDNYKDRWYGKEKWRSGIL